MAGVCQVATVSIIAVIVNIMVWKKIKFDGKLALVLTMCALLISGLADIYIFNK